MARTTSLAWSLTLPLLVACAPAATADDGDDAASTTHHESATANATVGGADTEAPARGDPCLLGDPDACPDGCVAAIARPNCTDAAERVCIASTAQPYDGPPSTYWILAADGPLYVEVGSPCGIGLVPGDAWAECSDAPTDPDGCACFCRQGWCMGDEDRRALEGCDTPLVCGPLGIDEDFGAFQHDVERCIFESLRDGVPGLYETQLLQSFGSTRTRLYVDAQRMVQRVIATQSDDIGCPFTSPWSGAEACELQPSEYFEACMQPSSLEQECVFTVDEWATNCTPTTPTCGG